MKIATPCRLALHHVLHCSLRALSSPSGFAQLVGMWWFDSPLGTACTSGEISLVPEAVLPRASESWPGFSLRKG